MAAILDRCVPARRRERKRQKELTARLDSRWGDTAITAPTMGGWNQPSAVTAPDKEYATTVSTRSVSTSDAKSSTNTSPSIHNGYGKFEKGKPTFTIQIPYDYARDDTFVEDCLSPFTPSDPEFINRSRGGTDFIGYQTIMEEANDPVTRPSTSSPAITYKPVSEQYKKELENLCQPPSRLPSPHQVRNNGSVDPAVILKPASEEYKKELSQMANGISRAQSPQSLRSQNTSPALRLRPSEEYLVDLVSVSRANSPPQPGYQLPSNNLPLRARSPSDTGKPGSPPLGMSRSNSPRSHHNASPIHSNRVSSDHVGNVSQFGMIPSPTFPEKSFAHMTTSSSASPPHSPKCRDSVSSATSHETGLSATSSRGIGVATISRRDSSSPSPSTPPLNNNNSNGTYYKTLADEYKLIAKDVEYKTLNEMERKTRAEEAAKSSKQRDKKEYYGPQELVPTAKDLWG